MKLFFRMAIILGVTLITQGCAVYPYAPAVAYDGYAPYSSYNYGYQPFVYFGRGGGSYRGYHGWGGGRGWNGYHGWGGGHGRR